MQQALSKLVISVIGLMTSSLLLCTTTQAAAAIVDRFPVQISGNSVLFIVEMQAFIYFAASDSSWRYSVFNSNNGMATTYMLPGLRTVHSYASYFIEEGHYLYVYDGSYMDYQRIDVDLLLQELPGFLSSGRINNAVHLCSSYSYVQKLGNVYFHACLKDHFYTRESSLTGLQSATPTFPFSSYISSPGTLIYISNGSHLLAYKGITYILRERLTLVDYEQDIFYHLDTADQSFLCKAFLGTTITAPSELSCRTIPNVFRFAFPLTSNNKAIVFTQNLAGETTFYDADTFNVIRHIGDTIAPVKCFQCAISWQSNLFVERSQYSFVYDSLTGTLTVAVVTASLSTVFHLMNTPFYHLNSAGFGGLYSVLDDTGTFYLHRIHEMYPSTTCTLNCCDCRPVSSSSLVCQKCIDNYVLQSDFTCKPNCPIECTSCSSPLVCSACDDGYRLLLLTGHCSPLVCQPNESYSRRIHGCVPLLEVVSVQLLTNQLNNLLTIQLNRIPDSQELADLSWELDDVVLMTKHTDYEVVSGPTVSSSTSSSIDFELRVTRNRVTSLLRLTLAGTTTSYALTHSMLYTETCIQRREQQSVGVALSHTLTTVSRSLVPSEGLSRYLVEVFKQLQLIGEMANFVQLLGPVLLLRGSLPLVVEAGTTFGASCVFQRIPDSSVGLTEYQTLQALGLQDNFMASQLFPHIALQVAVILCSGGMVVAALSKQKRYAGTKLTHFVLNRMSSLQQGFITPTLCSLFYSIKYSKNYGATAVVQLALHIVLFSQMSWFLLHEQDSKLISERMPNLVLNINTHAKGWRSYTLTSYLKKYTCIVLLLTMNENPQASSFLIASIFLSSFFYLSYFRFFNHLFWNTSKLLQELSIAVLFLMLAVCIGKWEAIFQSTTGTVSEEELETLDAWSTGVVVSILICLALSFVLFVLRTALLLRPILSWRMKSRTTQAVDQHQPGDFSSVDLSSTLQRRITASKYPFLNRLQRVQAKSLTPPSTDH